MTNFDELINREGTCSLKYDFSRERGKPNGLLPMWVADMDFRAPEPVIDALKQAAEHGIFGYTAPKEDYYEIVSKWFEDHHSYGFRREYLIATPGVVFALAACVRAFTEEGDAVLIQRPVYYPFTEVIEDNARKLVNNPLVQTEDGDYVIDTDDFERKIVEEKVKLFLLCNPHNPVGRVFRPDELERMGNICLAHGVLVVSDEIHCDFTFPGHTHTVFRTVNEKFADISLTCNSPSKTFNLAGLQISNIIIENPWLRKRFREEMSKTGYSQPPLMGIAACRAAYEYGEPWYRELIAYLTGNLDFLRNFLNERIPKVKLVEPEGTYLAWLDFRSAVASREEADDLIVNRAGLWLDDGTLFGPEGDGFQRMNIACPRSVLKEALERIERALR